LPQTPTGALPLAVPKYPNLSTPGKNPTGAHSGTRSRDYVVPNRRRWRRCCRGRRVPQVLGCIYRGSGV